MPGLTRAIVIVAVICVVVMVTVVVLAVSGIGAATDGAFLGPLIWIGTALVLFIVVFFVIALLVVRKVVGANADLLRQTAGASGELSAAGLPGTATVLSVRDTGMTLNHINAVMELALRVTADGQPPYDTKARVTLARQSWGAVQPGMTVGVRIDPRNRRRVAVDLAADAGAGAGAGAEEGMVQTPGGSFPVPGIAGAARAEGTVSTDDILDRGVRGEAEIRSLGHTGATAAQMVPAAQLRPEQADDPMVHVVLQVRPPDRLPFETRAIMRVPDGKLALLAIGKRVPVAWMADAPDTVTIDWDALR